MSEPVVYPEFMVRVKLPSSSAYHSSPSGDTEYEDAYQKAIFALKPPGFEVIWPRLNQKWPVDSEGYTWVRLYCSDPKEALAYWMKEAQQAQAHIARIKQVVG